jgi:hypothetical protein
VCSAGCGKELPRAHAYRVVGGGVVASSPFTLNAPEGGSEVLEVQGASKAMRTLGAVTIVIGMTVGLGGLYVGGLAYSYSCGILDSGNPCQRKFPPWFGPVVGGGVVLAVIGLVLVIDNARTNVVQHVKAAETPSPPPDSLLRMPTWRVASPEQTSLPAALGIPIASGRF